ncbi:hypothetical protein HDV03_004950 [Kappamyces sp. JEL0829]|nr:hypothetical protein HDV03_004950 [Kappamyces sp. JEL0829]
MPRASIDSGTCVESLPLPYPIDRGADCDDSTSPGSLEHHGGLEQSEQRCSAKDLAQSSPKRAFTTPICDRGFEVFLNHSDLLFSTRVGLNSSASDEKTAVLLHHLHLETAKPKDTSSLVLSRIPRESWVELRVLH